MSEKISIDRVAKLSVDLHREHQKTISFLNLLISGGKIISSNNCTPEDIATARAENRMHVNDDGYGFIYLA